MVEEHPKGYRYSLLYLKPSEATNDSPRLRMRLLKYFEAIVPDVEEVAIGQFLERELGIKVLRTSTYPYMRWEDLVGWEMRDILCAVTLVGKYQARRGRIQVTAYRASVSRIFEEESANFVLDEGLGVHPLVDPAYRLSVVSAVRGTEGEVYTAARSYIAKADAQLMPDKDRREAVRAAFSAVENVFKMMFDGVPQMNKANIQSHLRPWLDRSYNEAVAKRVAQKTCDGMQDWADACHNYRHAEGEAEPELPPEHVAVALVSQGLVYLRWLVDQRRIFECKN